MLIEKLKVEEWARLNKRSMDGVIEVLTPRRGVTQFVWDDVTVTVKSGINGYEIIQFFHPEG